MATPELIDGYTVDELMAIANSETIPTAASSYGLESAPMSTMQTPAYDWDISTPTKRAAVAGVGGLLGIGDTLFNLPSNLTAALSASPALFTSAEFLPEFQARREQLAQAKELYRQAASQSGLSVNVPLIGEMPASEVGAMFFGPQVKALVPVKGASLIKNLARTGGGSGLLGALMGSTAVETKPEDRVAAALGGAAVGLGFGSAATLASPIAKLAGNISSEVSNYAKQLLGSGAQTEEGARKLIGKYFLPKIATDSVVETAAIAKNQAAKVNPSAEALTTAAATKDPNIAMTEKIVSQSPAGDANLLLSQADQNIVKAVNSQAKGLVTELDPSANKVGESIKKSVKAAKEKMWQEASSAYTPETKNIKVDISGTRSKIEAAEKTFYKDPKETIQNSNIEQQFKRLQSLEKPKAASLDEMLSNILPTGEKKVGQYVPVSKEVELGVLHDIRSKLLNEVRKGKADALTPDQRFALELVDVIDNSIDATSGTQALREANSKWRNYKQTFVWNSETKTESPLRALMRQSDDKVAQYLTQNNMRFSALADLPGVDLTPLLDEKLSKFINLSGSTVSSSIAKKLAWIDRHKSIFEGTTVGDELNKIKTTLENRAESQALGAGGKVENLENLGVGDRRLLSIFPRSAQANAPITGADIFTRILSGAADITLGKRQQTAKTNIGRALTAALKDPNEWLKMRQEAGGPSMTVDVLKGLGRGLSSVLGAGSDKLFERGIPGRLAGSQTIQDKPIDFDVPANNLIDGYTVDELMAIANSGNEPSATPTPTAAPETIKIGKQNISIPQGEKFAPANLVKAVIKVESGGKAKAVSPKGASGLMQIMPGTAKELGVTDVFDPQQNVEAGSKYLNQQIDEFGDQKLALAAYNWGPGNMAAARRKLESKGIDFTWSNLLKYVSVPNETENYVNKVMSLI